MVIREDTTIWELVKAGIMPEWMAQECDDHGMTKAEYVLCEFDWEYGWDLGDFYTKEQSEILERVRIAIREGIEAFRSNPELVREYEEKKALKERKEKLRGRYKKELQGYIKPEDIGWIVNYIIEHDDLPYLYLLVNKIIYGFDKLSDRQKARLMQIGVLSGTPLPIGEIRRMFPDLRISVFSWCKHRTPWKLIWKPKQYFEALSFDTPLREDSPIWEEIMRAQHITGVRPKQIMRMVAAFRDDYGLDTTDDGKLILISQDRTI